MQPDEVRQVVALATRAPSVLNTQPWRFRASADVLDLHADRSRQLPHLDPLGRQLAVSCGGALVFARLALGAAGWAHHVDIMPNHDDFDHLARIVIGGRCSPEPDELELTRAIARPATCRDQFADRRLPDGLRVRLAADATAEGAWLRWVDSRADRVAAATLLARATRVEEADPGYRAEIRRWRPAGGLDGVPASVPAAGHRASDGPSGGFRFDDGSGTDGVDLTDEPPRGEQPDVLVVGTDFDGPAGWLAAGQAIARILLRVTAAGAAACPLSQVLDLPWTREQLRRQLGLASIGHPQMLLRLGYGILGAATSRCWPRPVDDVLELVAGTATSERASPATR